MLLMIMEIIVMEKITLENTQLVSFFNGTVKIYNDYMDRSFPTLSKEQFTISTGSRYIRIDREHSVHCFVDRTNGDVLKPATYKSPAKHARGNIFDESNGLSRMTEFGPAYLR